MFGEDQTFVWNSFKHPRIPKISTFMLIYLFLGNKNSHHMLLAFRLFLLIWLIFIFEILCLWTCNLASNAFDEDWVLPLPPSLSTKRDMVLNIIRVMLLHLVNFGQILWHLAMYVVPDIRQVNIPNICCEVIFCLWFCGWVGASFWHWLCFIFIFKAPLLQTLGYWEKMYKLSKSSNWIQWKTYKVLDGHCKISVFWVFWVCANGVSALYSDTFPCFWLIVSSLISLSLMYCGNFLGFLLLLQKLWIDRYCTTMKSCYDRFKCFSRSVMLLYLDFVVTESILMRSHCSSHENIVHYYCQDHVIEDMILYFIKDKKLLQPAYEYFDVNYPV